MSVVFALSGCGGPRIKNVTPIEKSRYSAGAVPDLRAEDVPEYLIGRGDVLKIIVIRHPELSGSVKVGSYGEIRLPESNDVIIADKKTTAQLEKDIAAVISAYMKSEPVVIVCVESFNSKFIYVLGAVEAPGRYALKDSVLTLRDAVFLAGMPAGDADLRRLVVVNPDFEQPIATGVDFMEIMYGGRMKYNIALNEGDIVFLPYTKFSKTVKALDMVATPLGKAAGGLAAALYIKDELEED
jgi:polysaccharide export outer membrane protein